MTCLDADINQVKKMGFEVRESWDRLIEGLEFLETAELDLDLGAMRIRTSLPVLDRYSPLNYTLAQCLHWDLASRKGPETCARLSLEQVHIL